MKKMYLKNTKNKNFGTKTVYVASIQKLKFMTCKTKSHYKIWTI